MTKKNKWRLRSSIGVKTNRPFFRSSSFNAKIWLGFMDWLTPRLPENPNQKIKFVNRQNLELKVAIWRKKCYLKSNTYFRSSSFNVLSRAKIGIGVKTENLSNDRIQNWIQRFDEKKIKYWCENKSALFFDHLHSTLRSQDRNRCHEMIDPKIDVRAPFWRTFQWSVASHPFWEFGQWNSQQSPLWLTHVTFSTNTHPSTLQASTMQYKSAPASALLSQCVQILY